jgi:hypothetical protein
MSERFDDDMMEDLMAEAPEGSHAMDEFDEADEAEGFDEAEDSLEDLGDDSLEESFDSFESEDSADEMEEAVTDALEADDADEFFGGLKSILKKVGSVARTVAPIAGMLPLPGAQLIGKAAGLIGNVMADEGDEMDALDSLADYAEEEDGFDALAPAVAGLAIRGALKHKAALIPRVQRRKLVKVVTAATKHIARKHGRRAVAAMPAIVEHARRIAIHRRLGAKHLPALVARTARLATRSPKVLRKLVHASTRLRNAPGGVYRIGGHRTRYRRGGIATSPGIETGGNLSLRGSVGRSTRASYGASSGGGCPHCRRRSYSFAGPVTVTIQSR